MIDDSGKKIVNLSVIKKAKPLKEILDAKNNI